MGALSSNQFSNELKYLFRASFTARAPGSTSDVTALKACQAM